MEAAPFLLPSFLLSFSFKKIYKRNLKQLLRWKPAVMALKIMAYRSLKSLFLYNNPIDQTKYHQGSKTADFKEKRDIN